jgi:hypothetical protein
MREATAMDFTCYEVEPGRVPLRAASHRRQWMDETPSGYAYRCVPLSVANAHGWELLCPVSFAATWNGGAKDKDVSITYPDGPDSGPPMFLDTHFGSGIITFNPLLIFRTPKGYDLWIGAPANEGKDGIVALNAVVETDWMPFTFTMNWRFTRKKQWIRFQKGEPFAFFFPVQRGIVEQMEPKIVPLASDPVVQAHYVGARVQRNLGKMVMQKDGDQFQGWYAKGDMPDGSKGPEDHRVRSRPKEFAPG